MQDQVTPEKLEHYFKLTGQAIEKAKQALNNEKKEQAEDFLNMATCYFKDARYFERKGDLVTAFAALNYAHGWLDAGARSGLFKVKDSHLFTVD